MDHAPKYQTKTMKLLQDNINGTFWHIGGESGVLCGTPKPQSAKVK